MMKFSFFSIILLIILELVCRYFGLNQFPLFVEDKDFEYIHKPNQNTQIYRNHFFTNEFSMRSLPIQKNDTLVVLLIGDSILNGTNQVSNEELASTILEDSLKETLKRNIRVLNVSSYSWGPDNAYSYLNRHGTFSADLVVFILNSGDTYDNMTFEKVVGVNDLYNIENYDWATIKLIEKI